MSETRWTPGPWEPFESIEEQPFPAGCPQAIGTAKGRGSRISLICSMRAQGTDGYDPVMTWANAHLIAAAPEMYEALYELMEAYNTVPLDVVEKYSAEERCRAVMAAARGETQ